MAKLTRIVILGRGFAGTAVARRLEQIFPPDSGYLKGITGGNARIPVPADRINLRMVLGNKVVFESVNANRRYFELGVKHFGEFEERWPGPLSRFITKRLPACRLTSFARAWKLATNTSRWCSRYD